MAVEITQQKLDQLFAQAMDGNADAEKEFRRLSTLLAKRINTQMLQQEKSKLRSETYYALRAETGTKKARLSARLSRKNLLEIQYQNDMAMRVYTARDYTLEGAKRQQEKNVEKALVSAGIDKNIARDISGEMNDLFKSDAWKEFKKSYGKGTTNLVISAGDAMLEREVTAQDFIDAYNLYMENRDNMDIVQAWEKVAGTDTWI